VVVGTVTRMIVAHRALARGAIAMGGAGPGSSRQHAAAFGISASSGTSAGRAGRSTIRSHEEGSDVFCSAVAGRRGAASLAGEDARPSRREGPRNKGMRYPADPPTVDEIVAVMRRAGAGRHGRRLRALIVVLWRAGLRI
jgi:hypothetical protein